MNNHKLFETAERAKHRHADETEHIFVEMLPPNSMNNFVESIKRNIKQLLANAINVQSAFLPHTLARSLTGSLPLEK